MYKVIATRLSFIHLLTPLRRQIMIFGQYLSYLKVHKLIKFTKEYAGIPQGGHSIKKICKKKYLSYQPLSKICVFSTCAEMYKDEVKY